MVLKFYVNSERYFLCKACVQKIYLQTILTDTFFHRDKVICVLVICVSHWPSKLLNF